MATNQPIVSSKTTAPLPQSPAQSQGGSVTSGESSAQRRSGGSSTFGAGASTRTPTPRNNQAAKKQNKGSKKYNRFADEDAMAESAAVRSTSSRKGQTSITHLMNFSLPPRPQSHQNYGHGRYQRRNPTWGMGSGYHAVDKARYVHANYRFIVDPRGNYHHQSIDADVHLDWSSVLQILVSSKSQSASCPVCLDTPVAPRMAKCGHIFCLTCLIRYMHSDDGEAQPHEKRPRWKKCPICWDSIYISETRPARLFAGQEGDPPREGGDVVLRLVTRLNGSTLALPRDGAESLPKGDDTPWYMAAEVMDYARIMKGSEDYMNEQFDNDIQEIERQEKEDDLMYGDDTAEWSRKAIRAINESKEKTTGIGNPPTAPSKPVEPKPKKPPIQFHDTNLDVPDMYSIQNAAKSGQSLSDYSGSSKSQLSAATATESSTTAISEATSDASGNPSRRPSNSALSSSISQFRNRQMHGHQPPSEYYFYQALLHYYLSPLDIRILREAFGNFSSFPSTILPRVERVSTGHIVDDELRRRVKYLSHLPYGCEVSFLECDWTDTVAPEILERFNPEIERRRKRNQDKEARDEKARAIAEREEERRYDYARRKRAIDPEEMKPMAIAPETAELEASSLEHISASPPWPTHRGNGSAFASLASPSTSPSASRTVWGTPAIAPVSPPLQPVPHQHEEVDDGWLQGWERDLLQEEDMVVQAQNLSLAESSKSGTAGGSGSGGGKKKKPKKITLMSTNARRGA
ncbi:hypothetical protein NA57DRAFT_70953 [Rhizodiscina lignyota]|uniref:RING-type domain-containing protein n=1 Tax=Rhizodiscina lignyota TaxID=1504668 RepID=A0A9P4IUX2_9PEZI|nr:hypothetical protein NA57DRAFT_70953 [Rhizodiscina lignyota]